MNEYNLMNREPEYKSLRNRLEDILYPERRLDVKSRLFIGSYRLGGLTSFGIGILSGDSTVFTIGCIGAGVLHLYAGLECGRREREKNKD